MLIKIHNQEIEILNNSNLLHIENYLCFFKGYFFINEHFFSRDEAVDYLIKNIESFQSNEKYDSLNGIFSCMIINLESKEINLFSDRIGPVGLYYHYTKNNLVVSDDVFSIYKNNLDIEVDMVSLFEMLSYRFVTGKYTMLKNVFQINPASVINFNFSKRGSITKHENRYWDYSFNPIKDSINKIEEKCNSVLNNIMKRFARVVRRKKVALNLSGGYDSRCILGLMLNNGINKSDLKCITFGHSDSEDITITSKIRDTLNIKLELILDIKNYDKLYDREFILSSIKDIGYSSYYFQAYYPKTILEKLYDVDFLFTGDVGFTSGLLIDENIYNIGTESALLDIIDKKNRTNIGLSPKLIKSIISKEIKIPHIENKLKERILESIGNNNEEYHIRYFKWYQENRLRKYVLKTYDIFSKETTTFLPFYDNDFIDFMFSIPFKAMKNQRVFLNTMNKYIFRNSSNSLRKLPYDKRGKLVLKNNDYVLNDKKPSRLTNKFNKIFRYKTYYKYHFERDNFPVFHLWKVNKQIYFKEICKFLEGHSMILDYKIIKQIIERNNNNISFLKYGLKNILTIVGFEKIVRKYQRNKLSQS